MTDRVKLQYSEKNWFHRRILDCKYHRDCPGIETGQAEANRIIPDTAALLSVFYKPQNSIPKSKFKNFIMFIIFLLLLYVYT